MQMQILFSTQPTTYYLDKLSIGLPCILGGIHYFCRVNKSCLFFAEVPQEVQRVRRVHPGLLLHQRGQLHLRQVLQGKTVGTSHNVAGLSLFGMGMLCFHHEAGNFPVTQVR